MVGVRGIVGDFHGKLRLLRRHGNADRRWWEALWPDPAGVLRSVGIKPAWR